MEVRILEEECIGCGACVPVCSTGAITFDDDEMKAVVARDECVGCEDCIPMCAVEAIVPDEVEEGEAEARPAAAAPKREPAPAPPRRDGPPPSGSSLPGGPGSDPADRCAAGCSCEDERFDLGSWRPGQGKLRSALRRRLRRRGR